MRILKFKIWKINKKLVKKSYIYFKIWKKILNLSVLKNWKIIFNMLLFNEIFLLTFPFKFIKFLFFFKFFPHNISIIIFKSKNNIIDKFIS
jgi:hypothetical protein